MAFATKSANTWSVDDVCEYLQQLELGHLQPKFRENAVSGSDLTSLSEDDFHTELGVTKLQYRKIKTGLDSLAGAAGSGPVPPAAAPPIKEPANGVPVGYPAGGAAPTATPPAGYPGAPAGYPAPNPYTAAGAPVAGAPVYSAAGGSAAPADQEAKGKASQLLQQSLQLLQQSLESVKSAQKTAGGMMVGNMVMNRPRPFMGPIGRGGRFGPNPMQTMGNVAANSAENAKLEKADMLAKQAATCIEQAQALVPQIPSIDMQGVKTLKKGVAGAVLAPGLSQAMRAGQIGKQASALETTITQVQSALRWLQNM